MPYILTSLPRVTYSHLPLLVCQPLKAGTHLTGYALHPYFPPYSHLQLTTTTGLSAFQGRHPSHRICPTSLLPSLESPTANYHYWRVSLSRQAPGHLTGYALHPYFPPYSHLQLPTTTGVSAFQARHPSHRICPTSLLPSLESPTATYHYWRVSLSRQAPISQDMPYILTSLPTVTYSHLPLLACQPFKAGTHLTGYALHPYFPP